MPYALCPMPYALCPMPYSTALLLRKATFISLSSLPLRSLRTLRLNHSDPTRYALHHNYVCILEYSKPIH
ncbi:MAG: hypothetical protein WBL95_12730 [Microcoleus sp.]